MLPIAPSTYYAHKAMQADPTLRSVRAQRDELLKPEIRRVWMQNFQVYGAKKVWKQLNREGITVARCTVARLMKDLELCGVTRRQRFRVTTHTPDGDERQTRLGLKLSSGRTMGVGLEFGRRESVDFGPEDAMLLRGELRF